MTLFMIGIGLDNEKDISVKGLEAIKECDYIYLEDYTSKLNVDVSRLEKFYSKKIMLADRELAEKNADEILNKAIRKNVAFLVIGDVFAATTHSDLYLRARKKAIKANIIHNASILTAVGEIGLELYKYGRTTSMPYFEKSYRPETPYIVTKENIKAGLHTLILLDVKKDLGKYMTVYQVLEQLLEIENKKKGKIFAKDTKIVGCARLGSDNTVIKYGKISELIKEDFGKPLHCIVVPGKLHFIEEEMLGLWE